MTTDARAEFGAVGRGAGIDRLLSGWREEPNHSCETEASADLFLLLGPACPIRPPNILMPPLMNNHGDYIFSLGNFCHWLAGKAEG